MQLTSTRKKANAITSNILNRIAVRGQRKVADALGINESQISRWKDSFIPKMAMLLAVLEWGVEDEELAKLAKKVAMVLTKKSLKTAATVLRPDVERLDQSTGVIMTNTAKILNFGRGNFTGQERNVADLDDGYARLSNMLLEAYSGADLTKRQFKVLLAILRKTYGWNKPMDRITDSQLSEITKLPVKRCNEAKLELVRMNIIKQQGGMFGPNKNISEWCIPQNEGKSPKTRDKTSLKLGDCYPSKQGDTKDTITKEKRKDYSSENSGESSDQPENDLSVVKPDAAIQSGSKWGTAEDLTAAEWMFDMVKTIAPSARKPNFAGWANDIRLMRERDGRNHRDMCVLFRWACQDNFWSGNVLSPAKLRDKWTQLEINRNKQQAVVTASKPKLDLTNTDWIYGVDL